MHRTLKAEATKPPAANRRAQQPKFNHFRSEFNGIRLKARIDSDEGRELKRKRFATVESVFGNLRANKRLNRFTLHGREKVDGQWQLFCLVQNIEKVMRHGYAQ